MIGIVGVSVSLVVAAAGTLTPPVGATTAATTLSSGCTSILSATVVAFSSGATGTKAQQIVMTPPGPLQNPAVANGVNPAQTMTVSVTVYGVAGHVVIPTPAKPVTVTIQNAPAGAIISTVPAAASSSPVTVRLTSGSSFTLTYAGSYLAAPLDVTASATVPGTNQCTGTAQQAVGTATIPLATRPASIGTSSFRTPTLCTSDPTLHSCVSAKDRIPALGLKAAAGYGSTPPTGKIGRFTIDTGSIGTVVPIGDLGPAAIGPGAPALKFYDSSGNEFVGFTYLAPITLEMGSATVTAPIRVLGVEAVSCYLSGSCSSNASAASFHYLGIGFDRESKQAQDPFASPSDNALLQAGDSAPATFAPGYILNPSSITAGITADNSSAFRTESLTASQRSPGDYLGAPGCISFPVSLNGPATPTCGSLLVDVGISQMYVTFRTKKDKFTALPTGGLPANQEISITTPGESPALSYSFSSGPIAGGVAPPQIDQAPTAVDVSVTKLAAIPTMQGQVFVNLGRNAIATTSYLFDAVSGQIGFGPLPLG